MNHSEQIRNMKPLDKPKYLMATTAIHKMGDLSRPDSGDNLCNVSHETPESWIGMWVTGFGFFHVVFPKSSTRELTEDEIKKYNSQSVQISSQPPMKLKVD